MMAEHVASCHDHIDIMTTTISKEMVDTITTTNSIVMRRDLDLCRQYTKFKTIPEKPERY